jgi:hypothetical protein
MKSKMAIFGSVWVSERLRSSSSHSQNRTRSDLSHGSCGVRGLFLSPNVIRVMGGDHSLLPIRCHNDGYETRCCAYGRYTLQVYSQPPQRTEGLLGEVVIADVPNEHDRGAEPVRSIGDVGCFSATAAYKVGRQKIMTRFRPSFSAKLEICIDAPEGNDCWMGFHLCAYAV